MLVNIFNLKHAFKIHIQRDVCELVYSAKIVSRCSLSNRDIPVYPILSVTSIFFWTVYLCFETVRYGSHKQTAFYSPLQFFLSICSLKTLTFELDLKVIYWFWVWFDAGWTLMFCSSYWSFRRDFLKKWAPFWSPFSIWKPQLSPTFFLNM